MNRGVRGLRVHSLGPLRLFRDDRAIPSSAWIRQKSRTLFYGLLCARPGRIHKEELMELLWPGCDPDRSSHALQVALSDLRSVLAGGAARQEARSFIHRSGEHYSLDVGPMGFVDAETFEAECEAGRAADVAGDRDRTRTHLHAAEQLYVGDFLAEEHFMDWAETRRERLRDLYIASMQRLIRLYELEGRLDLVVTLTKRLLAVDPYLESYYRDLMRNQKRMGDLGGVVQTYLRCQQAMRDGFDTDVQPETRAVAEKLLGPPVDSILQRHAAARHRSLPRRVVRGLPGRALSHAS